MKNKKIILGLGTITALGAMSVGFIACVKEEKVKEIVGEKTKDLSKLKKDDLNDKFKTLEDKIAALEQQLKETAGKTQIDALLKQILDEKINQFDETVGSFFGTKLEKTSFKKSMYDKNDENKNTGINLLKSILGDKYTDFENKFDIVNEKALESKITDDKFKLKIVAKGRSATNSPLFVKEIEIKFFDVLVDDNEIIKNIKSNIQGFKDKDAVEKEITLLNNKDIEKLEVDSVNGIDVTIKVKMKENKTIDEDKFVIKGAIAPTLLASHMDGLKITNKTTDEQILKHLKKHKIFENISSNDITITRKASNEEADGKIEIKSKEYSDSVKKLNIQGNIEIKIKKLEKLILQSIKGKITGINNLDSLEKVNEALKKIKIDGVKKLEAIVKEGSTTDVVITITPEESTHYIDDKDKKFEISGAIKKTEDKKDEAKG